MTWKRFKVRLAPQGDIFDCASDQSILLAGLAAGVSMPWSCRNGTCRTCMTRVVEGEAVHQIPWPGLSAEEKLEGWILPCVACPRSDLVLSRG